MSPLKILFCGTSAFALPSLKKLAQDPRFVIVGVISQPDRPAGRKGTLTPSPISNEAKLLKLPLFTPESLNKSWLELKEKIGTFDILVVVSYGQILSEEILKSPQKIAVNVHASLLPKLRGASPLQHAILENFSTTGVTIQRMVRELDAGPILAQQTLPIHPRETYLHLHDTLAVLGADLLCSTIAEPLHEQEQDVSQATFCKKLSRSDGLVDPLMMTAEEIDRKIRALVPWPGVRIGTLKLLESSLVPHVNAYNLPCKNNTLLYPTLVQPDGKKLMTGAEYARGNK